MGAVAVLHTTLRTRATEAICMAYARIRIADAATLLALSPDATLAVLTAPPHACTFDEVAGILAVPQKASLHDVSATAGEALASLSDAAHRLFTQTPTM